VLKIRRDGPPQEAKPRTALPHSLVEDPLLPDLSLLLDEEQVRRELEVVWQSSCGEPVRVEQCRRVDTTYEPHVGCVATFQLRDGASARQTIGVVELDAAGTRFRLYQDDRDLPGLRVAADATSMGPRVAPIALDATPEAVEMECAVIPVHYKPSRSCVLGYEVSSSSGDRRTLFGKLAAGLERGHVETVQALSQAARANPLMPRIVPPAAHWLHLELWMQPEVVAAVDMTTVAFDGGGNRTSLLRAAGMGIATLHDRVAVPGPIRRIEDELRGLRRYEALLRQLTPELAPRFLEVVARIAELAGRHEEPDPVASHGALRTGQFLAADDGLTLVDLDTYCWANPARDVGNLLAFLDWRAIRNPAETGAVAEAQDAFLDGYSSVTAALDDRWLRLYRAATMLKIAGRRLRRLEIDDWPVLGDLVDAARATIRVD
jgi:hypothetical protein